MKTTKAEDITICLSIVSLLLFLSLVASYAIGCESYKMFNTTAKNGVMGIYYGNMYYCVWTKDKTEEEINRTDCHEACHHMVYNEWEHFCEEEKWIN